MSSSPAEKLMQYVWQHKLWLPSDMRTVDGVAVEVLDPGLLNSDAGPDFFNAKVRIDGRVWVGNVEIHVKASDWYRHGHDKDMAYDSVVLHVVDSDDCRISRVDGREIPQLLMRCARDFSESYHQMVNNPAASLACAAELPTVSSIYVTDWLTALAFERLYDKADRIEDMVRRLGGDWREAIYVTLARALGFHTNSDAFERLALSAPLSRLLRHQGHLTTIEGALMGQAGLLPVPTAAGSVEADYIARLTNEYNFVAAKYDWQRPMNLGWKMARMRPQNFPHRRIALLAAMVSAGFPISYNLLNVKSLPEAMALFDTRQSAFWSSHFTFEPSAGRPAAVLSAASINILIINVVVPVLYAYGRAFGIEDMQERAVELLHQLPAENNTVIRTFRDAGIACNDAFTGQALIELRRCYCEPRKCLYCRLGHRFLAAKAIRRQKC